MSDNEQKAQALVEEAEKKLNKSGGFFSNLFGYVIWYQLTSLTQEKQVFKKLFFLVLCK